MSVNIAMRWRTRASASASVARADTIIGMGTFRELYSAHGGTPTEQRGADRSRPDISEKGGIKDGQPQRSNERLFMQFLAFGGCADAPSRWPTHSSARRSPACCTRT